MNVRAVAPMIYGAAVVLAVLVASGTVVAAVAIVGAMLLGAVYVATRPGPHPTQDRSAARAERAQRRASR